ncbi:hypothetical protein CHS0354_025601 [Potamilus streckersoni]|uniref:Uncharacterized protein n=1 Tax=Potamilus streckersoni TaxID=2493646 RepID=A0AAE0VNR6_9BIVA|nr:hypothetical protein CHS0354_025601 [Potamilus streckersoni]
MFSFWNYNILSQTLTVPPTLRCKPSIKHEENFLIATLDNSEYCGKPLASVRWMEYTNISYRSKARIELPPGKEAGTYRACIEGETLKCLQNSFRWDNCENITIGYTREGREYCENITIGSTRESMAY